MESSGGLDFCVIFARRPSTAVRVVGSTGPEVLVRTSRNGGPVAVMVGCRKRVVDRWWGK